MSIIKSLQTWLKGFDGMELRPLSEIKTDRPEEYPSSYALAASGNSSHRDITGGYTYTHSYTFYAKEAVADEVERQENMDFIEAITEWVEEQADTNNMPVLPGRYEAEAVEVNNGMLLDIYEDGTGLYQVQIQLIFSRRSV